MHPHDISSNADCWKLVYNFLPIVEHARIARTCPLFKGLKITYLTQFSAESSIPAENIKQFLIDIHRLLPKLKGKGCSYPDLVRSIHKINEKFEIVNTNSLEVTRALFHAFAIGKHPIAMDILKDAIIHENLDMVQEFASFVMSQKDNQSSEWIEFRKNQPRMINWALQRGVSLEILKALTRELPIRISNLRIAIASNDKDKIDWLAEEVDRQIAERKELFAEIHGNMDPSIKLISEEQFMSGYGFGAWIKAIANENTKKMEEIVVNGGWTNAHKDCLNPFKHQSIIDKINDIRLMNPNINN